MSHWETIKDNPVIIGGHRKSGTTLLLALLDGHEELGTFPADSGFWYAFYPVYEGPEHTTEDKIMRIKNFSFKNIRNEYEHRIRDAKDVLFPFQSMEEDFAQEVRRGDASSRSVLLAMVGAYVRHAPVCQGALKRWVEKTTSTEIYANKVFEWFPRAKFIHVLRDPRDNFGSLKSGWEKRYRSQTDSVEWLLQSLLDRGKLGMEFAAVNQQLFGKQSYLIVRYEDLVAKPEEVLRTICGFLGIQYSPKLMMPTFFGRPWGGNNFDGLVFSSISKDNANRWQERITEKEAQIIEFHFRSLMEQYGYKTLFNLRDASLAAREHYRWFNYAQRFAIDAKTAAVPS